MILEPLELYCDSATRELHMGVSYTSFFQLQMKLVDQELS
jgi:hypothetical protein